MVRPVPTGEPRNSTLIVKRDPWFPSAILLRIVRDAPADSGLLEDLVDIREAKLDEV